LGGYHLTAIIEKRHGAFVARCLELPIASSGQSGAVALANLRDDVASFVAQTQDAEILDRLSRDVEVAHFEVARR
jgi:predicted RNase H-like HicB family nuclease